jgi:tetratricopeptide (TPR) repeat protein
VTLAIKQLQFIPRESPHFSAARVQEARMWLFAGLRPNRADALLREALAADSEQVEAHYTLWKLFDLTGRSHLAEPHFRAVLKAAPVEQRPMRLREWYMSQFYPATANLEIDQLMGFFDPRGTQNTVTELRRMEAFRDREPKSALNHAAAAKWYSLEGNPKHALELLQTALDVADAPLQEPYFVATLTQVLFDLGEFDRALKYFRTWPGERSGYEFTRLEAMLADEVERDFERAIRGYRQVIAAWPGQADWRIQFRLARCLAKSGDESAAEKMRSQAKEIELLMEESVHSPLRAMLKSPDQLEICERMTQFYEQLGLAFEAQQWRDQVVRQRQMSGRAERTQTP